MERVRPTHIAVAFDQRLASSFRNRIYPAYKANREPPPPGLELQFQRCREFCQHLGVAAFISPEYEADDIIGTLAHEAAKKNLEVLIVTSDKDMMQLVTENIRILNPAKGDLIIDEKKVEEIMGVPPKKVPDVMALMGDSIDNIPGARDPREKPAPGERRKAGIGDIGARQLIQEFGSAEAAIARAAEVKRSSYR